jgi:glycosyltransferase involved in cell wall biosynthesis
MAEIRTIAVCYPQVPFFVGGAELLIESLCRELNRRGHETSAVSIPYHWKPKTALLDQCLAWRLLDLRESNGKKIDRVIATKFPSYAVSHPNKVTWLTHQFRQVYDLFGTEFSDYGRNPDDLGIKEMIRRIDGRTLSESRHLYSLSQTVADRLKRFNSLDSGVLYAPPPRRDDYRTGPYGDYILSFGRLDPIKRPEPLIRAMVHTDVSLRCVVVGKGPEEAVLRELAQTLGVADRVDFVGEVRFSRLLELLSGCLAVYHAPFDEDYGFVTLEAFLSKKPVITAPDSGGPTEFIRDGETGLVVDLDPEKLGEAIRRLVGDREKVAAMGEAGSRVANAITWDPVIEALLKP